MNDRFKKRLAFGKNGQDILINFLERHFGYRFEAGERYDSVLNVDLIEELENCEYIAPSMISQKGSRLKFKKNNKEYILTMPDVLMSRNSSDGFYWIEAKTHSGNYSELVIDKENFLDYKVLYEEFTRQDFYVMCLNPNEFENTWDVYICEFGDLITNVPKEQMMNKNSVYSWDMFSVMEKLNKYPIKTSKYE